MIRVQVWKTKQILKAKLWLCLQQGSRTRCLVPDLVTSYSCG